MADVGRFPTSDSNPRRPGNRLKNLLLHFYRQENAAQNWIEERERDIVRGASIHPPLERDSTDKYYKREQWQKLIM